MSNTTDLQTALNNKLAEIDTALSDLNELKNNIGNIDISHLQDRVQTLENRYIDLLSDFNNLQLIFNQDHYQIIPSLQNEIFNIKNHLGL